MKKIFIAFLIIIPIFLYSQDKFCAFKFGVNLSKNQKSIENISFRLNNNLPFSDFTINTSNSIYFGLYFRKHIYNNIFLSLDISTKDNSIDFTTATMGDTVFYVDLYHVIGAASIEYVFYSRHFLKMYAAISFTGTYLYYADEYKKITYGLGTFYTDEEGVEREKMKTDKYDLINYFTNYIYKKDIIYYNPRFEVGFRFHRKSFFEPSICIQPDFESFTFYNKTMWTYAFNLKIGLIW